MAKIRETIETVFAAMSFAERNLSEDARDVMNQTQVETTARSAAAKRKDTRPRVRV